MSDSGAVFVFLWVIGWLVGCCAVAFIATQRGRSGWVWGLISLLLSPLLGYAVIVAIP
jgi:hypothetical protein